MINCFSFSRFQWQKHKNFFFLQGMMQLYDEDSPDMCVKYKVTSPTAYCDTGLFIYFFCFYTVTTKRLLGMRNGNFFRSWGITYFVKKINGRIK